MPYFFLKKHLLAIAAPLALVLLFGTENFAHSQILISKIQTAGASTTDEFVELYNNSSATSSLADWNLKKQTAAGTQYAMVSSFPQNALINPFGYYLIGHRDYALANETSADISYSNNSNSLADNNAAKLFDENGNLIDAVFWGNISAPTGTPATNPGAGKNLSRLPNDESGNSKDSDDSSADFIITERNPFNSRAPARPSIAQTLDEIPSSTNNLAPTSTDDAAPDVSTSTASQSSSTDIPTTTVESTACGDAECASSATIWPQLQLSEIVPNPDTGEEWVELYNGATGSLYLAGGTLCDGRAPGSCLINSPTGTIQANNWLVIYISSNRLNNDGDSVILKNPGGEIIDRITYGATLLPKKGEALARDENNNWVITTNLTPGAANSITPPLAKQNGASATVYSPPLASEPTPSSSSQTSADAKCTSANCAKATAHAAPPAVVAKSKQKNSAVPVSQITEPPKNKVVAEKKASAQKAPAKLLASNYLGKITLSAARNADKGAGVAVEGVVTALPGTFGRQYFYISDDEGGVEIFQSKKQFPALALGDRVRVIGTVSNGSGVKRVNVKKMNDIIVRKSKPPAAPTATLYGTDEITDDALGQLVKIKGEVTAIKTNYIYVDDGNGEMEIYFKQGAKIDKQKFKIGDQVEADGVLEQNKNGLQIWPRGNEDIKVTGLSSAALKAGQIAQAEQSKKLKEEYGAATAGGLTTVILAWLARARGAVAMQSIKRLAGGLIKQKLREKI